MARLKCLRGTALDLFGYTAERKMERALPGEYTAMIFRHLDGKLDTAAAGGAGKMPEVVRGYGHIKEANVARYRAECARLEAASASRSRRRRSRGSCIPAVNFFAAGIVHQQLCGRGPVQLRGRLPI